MSTQRPQLQPDSPAPRPAPEREPTEGRGGLFTVARRPKWLHRPVNDEGNTIGHVARLIVFGLLLLAILGATIAPWNSVTQVDLPPGSVSTGTYRAPRTATYISAVRTQEKRDEVANDDRLTVLKRNTTLIAAQQRQLEADIAKLADIRRGTAPIDDRVRAIQGVMTDLTSDEARILLQLDSTRWTPVTTAATNLLADTMKRDISLAQLARVKDDLSNSVDSSLSSTERSSVVALVRSYVKPNMTEDVEATTRRRDEARAAVAPVKVTIQENQTIVSVGDTVTAYQREQLEELGLLKPQVRWSSLLGTLGLVVLIVGLLVAYLYRFARPLWRSSHLVLLGLTIVLPVIVARFTLGSHPTWIYAFPIAATTMLAAILLNLQFATVVALSSAIMLGLLGPDGGSLEFATLVFVAGIVGALIVWQADRIATFLWGGIAVAGIVCATAICFRLVEGDLDVTGVLQIVAMAVFNGGVTSVLTFGTFTFLGGLFGITTHLQLLELAHPNQPLLYKLAREAPGTYHHSIIVSNLAESAVELIGGDPLLTRVSVLYHDIGKTLRPTFFIENQANRENVHDELDPRQSARIIIDHVNDGVKLAHKARLPEAIVDVIRQHHGTMLLRYFYVKAIEQGDDVREEDFRYPGPKPQTKEAGVIMLADSTEAAVRAASQTGKLDFAEEPRRNGSGPSRKVSKLQELVNQVIDERVKIGELDECDLTLRDIERIKATFVQVLDGIYHPRIDYPPAPKPKKVEEPVVVAS